MAPNPAGLAAMLSQAGPPPGGMPPGAPMPGGMGAPGVPPGGMGGPPSFPSTDPQALSSMLMSQLQSQAQGDQAQLAMAQQSAADQAMPAVSQFAAQLAAAVQSQQQPPSVMGFAHGGALPMDPMLGGPAPSQAALPSGLPQ